MRVKEIFSLLKQAFQDWSEDKATRLAAALAFYTVLSLAPLLISVVAVVGAIFGEDAARGRLVAELSGLVGTSNAAFLETIVAKANGPGSGWAAVLGFTLLIFGASGVFVQLQDGLNTIWEVAPRPGRGIRAMIKERLLSFGMVLGVAFLLMVSLVISAALSAFGDFVGGYVPEKTALLHIVNFVVSFGVITLLFALLFKVLPDVVIAWRDVWIGAGFTALLFTIGKLLIGLYLGSSDFASAYGAAGAIVILLVWLYYSAQIVFFGAEVTQAWAERYGGHIRPTKNAVPVTADARAQQGMPSTPALEQASAVVSPPGGSARRERHRLGSLLALCFGFALGSITGSRGRKCA